MSRSPYSSPYARLVANVIDAPGGCWEGTDKTRCRFNYCQVDFYIPGLKRNVKLMAHLCTWIWQHAGCATIDDLYLAYQELRASGLVLDHTCINPACRNPEHLEPVTQKINIERRHSRRSPIVGYDPAEVEF